MKQENTMDWTKGLAVLALLLSVAALYFAMRPTTVPSNYVTVEQFSGWIGQTNGGVVYRQELNALRSQISGYRSCIHRAVGDLGACLENQWPNCYANFNQARDLCENNYEVT